MSKRKVEAGDPFSPPQFMKGGVDVVLYWGHTGHSDGEITISGNTVWINLPRA